MAAKLQELLSRLDKCRETKVSKHDRTWTACCPAHDDKTPSMGIALTSDGKILLKCWAGCSVQDICLSVGMEITDLFPDEANRKRPYDPSEDEWAVMIGDAQIKRGKPLNDADKARYKAALHRIHNNQPSPRPDPDHLMKGIRAVSKREAERSRIILEGK